MARPRDESERLICDNRRATFDYEIDDTLEAGLALIGSEVKALRNGEANLSDSYALPIKGELFLHNAHIGQYRPAANFAHLPTRSRKLLLHKGEIEKWAARVAERGYTIVPLALYFKGARAKVKLGLGKGKNSVDRRQTIKERDSKREIDRAMRRR